MTDDIAIKVEHVSKTFKLPHEKQSSIKGALIGLVRGGKRTYERQEVLKDVSFEIKKGEFFGIVGRNGSGKSTLLKMLAGIYTPSKGHVQVNGKLTPFIELGVGFNPELTGRENVYLNGALLGFSRGEMDEMYEGIVSFSELERFMDQKLKNYSSGMQVRLAFSIAIRAKSEILLVDEVLAVGDSAFQKKCYEVFIKLKREGRTIVFVTHDMTAVERFCDKVLVLNKSEAVGVFSPSEAGAIYDKLNATEDVSETTTFESRWGTGEVKVEKVELLSEGKPIGQKHTLQTGKGLDVKVTLRAEKTTDVIIGMSFVDTYGVNIAGPNSSGVNLSSNRPVTFSVERLPLLSGDYSLTIVVFDTELLSEYDHLEKTLNFTVRPDDRKQFGKISMFGEWK